MNDYNPDRCRYWQMVIIYLKEKMVHIEQVNLPHYIESINH